MFKHYKSQRSNPRDFTIVVLKNLRKFPGKHPWWCIHRRLFLRLSAKAVVMVFCSRDAVARKCWNSCFEKNLW